MHRSSDEEPAYSGIWKPPRKNLVHRLKMRSFCQYVIKDTDVFWLRLRNFIFINIKHIKKLLELHTPFQT